MAVAMKSGRIWLVWGQSGEYDDAMDWVVCWYADKASADKHLCLAQEREKDIREWLEADDHKTDSQHSTYLRACKNKWDSGRVHDRGRDIEYSVGWCDAGSLSKKAIRKS